MFRTPAEVCLTVVALALHLPRRKFVAYCRANHFRVLQMVGPFHL